MLEHQVSTPLANLMDSSWSWICMAGEYDNYTPSSCPCSLLIQPSRAEVSEVL